MATRADRVILALRSGTDRLSAFVKGLPDGSLTSPSGASDWDISQVLSHLGSGAEIGLANLEGALDGTGPRDGDFNKSVWARWDAMGPAERASAFLSANEALVARYEAIDQATRESLRIQFGFLPVPIDVATAAGLRLNEFTLHTWDVLVPTDPSVTLAADATDLLVDSAGMLIHFIGKPDRLGGRQVTLTVTTTAPERSFGLAITDKVALTDTPAEPDGVLSAPAEYWLRLISGRHAPAVTPAAASLTSDKVSLDDLRQVFPGY